MSLVISTELSDTTYRNAKLYSLKGTNVTPDLSSHNFAPDKHRNMYMTDSYSSESYEKYFLDSPTEELIESSSSSISGNSIHPDGASSYPLRVSSGTSMITNNPFDTSFLSTRHRNAYQSNFSSDFLENGSPDCLDFDGEMRLKLQELERALLSDNNDEEEEEDIFETVQSMEIDPDMAEWVNPIQDMLLHDSPKESSSSDSSNISSISSTKEISQNSLRTPKKMLYDCALALSEGNKDRASFMINDLRQMVSIQGDPSQRIAAYMVEGLAARVASSGKCIYKALRCKEPPSSDRLAAMQILFEVCPCFKFGFIAANGAIAEAVRDEKKVHIIDFDINQGSQYITLIQTLASMPGKPPHVRLTGVDDPESVQRSVGGLNIIGQRLEKLAEALGLPFEFRAVASRTSIVTPSMLNCRPGEALVVNFAFQLHHMRDESVSTVNERDQLLRMVKSLNPKLVTVVEQDMNTNTSPFLQRFVETYSYYSYVFDSLDATLPRESQDRMNVERQCLAKDIVNIVACEGEDRIERYEVAGKWRARLTMAGFTSSPMSTNVREAIRKLIKQYCDRFKMKEEMGGLHFGWDDKNLIVASAWK
ncbi:scarecrow-like protein 1 [Abrus precatorius]|uniref:Scarecrow-like protein 1 n=1 Tax=Abrus precatorius TaxID=3816 RepID=A0A8B8JEX7_ABRPR|nr:scarecrow-like protein 1 [Abrus precatorius]XP_027330012.1 scarecrow-like protein 1 [Abrus precatorius]XP_027330013.1 scarecrow-like protein 1 [Abrus precatorius]XP_027330014.1 scarecrow-like protein 1 [Abrus precatorius]XP_027330015.1 scarecrow-like protein 1 [Abrus precatorius]XP_027330016.1 scarecrow-like protein 1 [Abrus precatorius]